MKNRRPIISLCTQSPLRPSSSCRFLFWITSRSSTHPITSARVFYHAMSYLSSCRPIALNLLSLLILQSHYQFVPLSALLSSYLYHKIERAFGGQLRSFRFYLSLCHLGHRFMLGASYVTIGAVNLLIVLLSITSGTGLTDNYLLCSHYSCVHQMIIFAIMRLVCVHFFSIFQ